MSHTKPELINSYLKDVLGLRFVPMREDIKLDQMAEELKADSKTEPEMQPVQESQAKVGSKKEVPIVQVSGSKIHALLENQNSNFKVQFVVNEKFFKNQKAVVSEMMLKMSQALGWTHVEVLFSIPEDTSALGLCVVEEEIGFSLDDKIIEIPSFESMLRDPGYKKITWNSIKVYKKN